MAITSIGAIYATKSRLLQRVYIPHDDDSEIEQQHRHPGETLLRVPIETYRSGGAPAVQALIGTPAHDGRCIVRHKITGEILDRIIADPDIYRHPEGHHVVLDR
jgi:hypothetical protein